MPTWKRLASNLDALTSSSPKAGKPYFWNAIAMGSGIGFRNAQDSRSAKRSRTNCCDTRVKSERTPMPQFDSDNVDTTVDGARVLLRFIKIGYVIEYCSAMPGSNFIDSRRS